MKRILRLFLLLGLLSPSAVQAFPEMIRLGYANCNSCHISPSGGGQLTDYGREIFAEALSTWSKGNEHKFLHGVPLPSYLKLGGDFRRIQTYVNTPQVKEGRWFLMQADVEAAVVTSKFTVDATVGFDPGSPSDDDDDEWISRRHYILVPFGEEWSVRAGKYLMNYGLMIPDHVAQIRGGLGWNQGAETYNGEVNYMSEKYSATVTGVGGRPDDLTKDSERGFAFNGARTFEPSYKVGFSYFRGKTTDHVDREIFGPYWVLGFKKIAYLLGEGDVVRVRPAGGGPVMQGFATYLKPGVVVYKGVDLHLTHETKKNDRDKEKLDFLAYGAGIQYSPRPHFIFTADWQKQVRPSSVGARTYDYAYFIVQYAL